MRRTLPALLLLASCSTQPLLPPAPGQRIAVGMDGRFVLVPSLAPFTPWGFNYDHDSKDRLLEDYWESEWETVVSDFQEMKALGANVVRIHLQVHRFLKSPTEPDPDTLARLRKLLDLAASLGIWLDLTGLGNYRKALSPDWYSAAPEADRWAIQARFWSAVAEACADRPAVFCYTLMNEPVTPVAKATEYHGGELGGFSYVERLTLDPAGRSRPEIARQWMQVLVPAIRLKDPRALVTCGSFHIFEKPGSLSLAPNPAEFGAPLDFLSVHVYPRAGKLDDALALLAEFAPARKPLVIQEHFPLHCGLEEFERFVDASKAHASGWISFYWGRTEEEYRRGAGMKDSILADWIAWLKRRRP